MVNLILNNLSKFAVAIVSLFAYFTYRKNKDLKVEKQVLLKTEKESKRLILTQKKIINVTKNHKAVNIDDNIKLMRDKNL